MTLPDTHKPRQLREYDPDSKEEIPNPKTRFSLSDYIYASRSRVRDYIKRRQNAPINFNLEDTKFRVPSRKFSPNQFEEEIYDLTDEQYSPETFAVRRSRHHSVHKQTSTFEKMQDYPEIEIKSSKRIACTQVYALKKRRKLKTDSIKCKKSSHELCDCAETGRKFPKRGNDPSLLKRLDSGEESRPPSPYKDERFYSPRRYEEKSKRERPSKREHEPRSPNRNKERTYENNLQEERFRRHLGKEHLRYSLSSEYLTPEEKYRKYSRRNSPRAKETTYNENIPVEHSRKNKYTQKRTVRQKERDDGRFVEVKRRRSRYSTRIHVTSSRDEYFSDDDTREKPKFYKEEKRAKSQINPLKKDEQKRRSEMKKSPRDRREEYDVNIERSRSPRKQGKSPQPSWNEVKRISFDSSLEESLADERLRKDERVYGRSPYKEELYRSPDKSTYNKFY